MFKNVDSTVIRIAVLAIGCILALVLAAFSQIEDVREAIAQKDHLEALRILSRISDESATPDTYLYRGIAYANLRRYERVGGFSRRIQSLPPRSAIP